MCNKKRNRTQQNKRFKCSECAAPKIQWQLWWQWKYDWILGKLTRGLYATLWYKKWSMWARDRREIGKRIRFAYCTPNKPQVPQLNLEGPPMFFPSIPPFLHLVPYPQVTTGLLISLWLFLTPSAYRHSCILVDHSVLIHLLNFSPAFGSVLICPFFQKGF